MKKIMVLILLAWPLGGYAAEEPVSADKPAAATQPNPAERNQMLYSLGFLLGDNLKTQLILDNENDYKALSQGMRDTLLGKKPQTDLEKYKPQIIQKYQDDARIIAEKRAAAQQTYLENFKKEKGVKTLENGAMVKLIKPGKGKNPKADSTVKVHYTGTLIDGTKFDSSRDRGEAFQTRLTDVIPCWTKAIQQLKPGARATVVCPSDTAYGSRPMGRIAPNSALVFDVELIEIVQ